MEGNLILELLLHGAGRRRARRRKRRFRRDGRAVPHITRTTYPTRRAEKPMEAPYGSRITKEAGDGHPGTGVLPGPSLQRRERGRHDREAGGAHCPCRWVIKQQRTGLDAVHAATNRRKELRRGLQ